MKKILRLAAGLFGVLYAILQLIHVPRATYLLIFSKNSYSYGVFFGTIGGLASGPLLHFGVFEASGEVKRRRKRSRRLLASSQGWDTRNGPPGSRTLNAISATLIQSLTELLGSSTCCL